MTGTAGCHCCASQAQFLPNPSPGIRPAEPGEGRNLGSVSNSASCPTPGHKGPSLLQPEAEMNAGRASSALCHVLIQEEHRLYLFIHQIYVASALYLKSLYS